MSVKDFKDTKKIIKKILQKLGDKNLDWTLQVSENTANPNHITYSCMIHVSDRLEPLVWTCKSWEELQNKLKQATKDLSPEMVDTALYQGEIARCKRLINYYEEKITEITSRNTNAESATES